MATREKVSVVVNGVKETRMVPRVPNSANAKPEEQEFTKKEMREIGNHLKGLVRTHRGIGGPY